MLSIIESMGKTWAAVAAQGDLRLYERDESAWVEIELQAIASDRRPGDPTLHAARQCEYGASSD